MEADNGVSLDFSEASGEITPQHYAFLVGEDDFDASFGRIREQGLAYWADPGQTRPGEINPDHIITPGIFVQRIVHVPNAEKRIEQRTVRKRAAPAGTGEKV